MAALWVAAALIASAAQTARNATQASLTQAIGTVGATQVRFLYGLPFAVVFLVVVCIVTGQTVPIPSAGSLAFTTFGAVSQIAATALMLITMKSRSFAVATAWIKTEPVMVALIAASVLGDPLTGSMLIAILIATSGVILMSVKPGSEASLLQKIRPAVTGILAGILFGASAIGFRGGILGLASGDFLIRATTTLVIGLTIQCSLLIIWLRLFDRAALLGSIKVWRASLGAGFLGAFASQFWFIGFSLTSAANIRTVALIEVIFAQAVSRHLFHQPVSRRQVAGMVVIMVGVGLLLRAQP